jgi:hypothetical protein
VLWGFSLGQKREEKRARERERGREREGERRRERGRERSVCVRASSPSCGSWSASACALGILSRSEKRGKESKRKREREGERRREKEGEREREKRVRAGIISILWFLVGFSLCFGDSLSVRKERKGQKERE